MAKTRAETNLKAKIRMRLLRAADPQGEAQKKRTWYDRNFVKYRAQYLKKYGITVEDYENMLVSQNGVCKICHEPETRMYKGTTARLSVDHDHKTNKVRGLLCDACNGCLGRMKDSPLRLRAAADYLEKSSL